jgi:hypothetical protein
MSAIDELAALVVTKARAEGVTPEDAIAFATVEISNVVGAEVEALRQTDRAELTIKLAAAEERRAAAEAELKRQGLPLP